LSKQLFLRSSNEHQHNQLQLAIVPSKDEIEAEFL